MTRPRMPNLTVAKIVPNAKLPTKAYMNDVGFDLYCSENRSISAHGITNVQCGIRIELPAGYWGMLVGRSSTSYKRGLLIVTAVIDPDYNGPMFVQVMNTTGNTVTVHDGDRLAQLVLIPAAVPYEVEEVSEEEIDRRNATYLFKESRRGQNGFGSSGA